MCTISIGANIYSHVKNKFIFVPGKWRLNYDNTCQEFEENDKTFKFGRHVSTETSIIFS